jgi:hypothetical protein
VSNSKIHTTPNVHGTKRQEERRRKGEKEDRDRRKEREKTKRDTEKEEEGYRIRLRVAWGVILKDVYLL